MREKEFIKLTRKLVNVIIDRIDKGLSLRQFNYYGHTISVKVKTYKGQDKQAHALTEYTVYELVYKLDYFNSPEDFSCRLIGVEIGKFNWLTGEVL